MDANEAKKEAERLSEMIKNSKLLTNEDMVWFDYIYNVVPVVNSCLDLYRREHVCTLEEALIKMVVEMAKTDAKLQEAYYEIKKRLDEQNGKDN